MNIFFKRVSYDRILIGFLYLVIICSAIDKSVAQYHSTKIYTAANQNSIANITRIYIDKTGKLWIGTYANGLIRFDGQEFKVYNQKNGFISSQALQVFEDSVGNIWSGSAEKGFSCLTDEEIKNYGFKSLSLDHFNMVDFCPYLNTVIFIDTLKSYKYDYNSKNLVPLEYSILEKSISTLVNFRNENWSKVIFQDSHDMFIIQDSSIKKLGKKIESTTLFNTLVIKDDIIFIKNNNIFKLNIYSKKQIQIFKSKDSITSIDKVGNKIYIGLNISKSDKSIREYDLELNYIREIHFQSPYPIKQITRDMAGNYWAASAQAIVKVLNSLIEFPINMPGMVTNITTVLPTKKGHLWIATSDNGLLLFDGIKIKPCDLINKQFNSFLDCSLEDANGNYCFNISGAKPGILVVQSPKKFYKVNDGHLNFFSGRDNQHKIILGMGRQEGIWISKSDPIIDTPGNFIKYDSSKSLALRNVLTVSEDAMGNLWCGRLSQGISVYEKATDKFYNYLNTDSIFSPSSLASCSDYKGNIWFGTDNGLYFLAYKKWHNKIQSLTSILEQIAPNIIGTSLIGSIIIKDNNLFIGNGDGIFILSLNDYYNGIMNIQNINREFGYNGGLIGQNTFWFDKDNTLWFSTSTNITGFKYDQYIKDTCVPQLKLSYIELLDGTQISDLNNICLHPGTTSINVKVRVDRYPLLYPNLSYAYSIDNSDYYKSNNNSMIELRNLNPGKHNLLLVAIKNGNIKSTPICITFEISPHWWEMKWLWWTLSLSLFASIIYLYQKNIEVEKQKGKLIHLEYEKLLDKKEKNNLQIQAIVNQLNPHFIKNALQYIQIKVAGNKEAVKVLGNLGDNINIVFKNTKEKKSYHKLSEEMLILKNYLSIQKYRFFDILDYKIPEDEEIESMINYEVPLMILQIHAENACEHGIKHLVGRVGLLEIKIINKADHLHFMIEDNGIGRKEAKKRGSSGTQEGVKMLYSLIQIFNETNKNKMRQWYEDDIFVINGIKCGTRVNFTMPKNYTFNKD